MQVSGDGPGGHNETRETWMEPVHVSSDVASQPVIGSIHLKPSKLTRTLVSSLVITMSTFEHAGQRKTSPGAPSPGNNPRSPVPSDH